MTDLRDERFLRAALGEGGQPVSAGGPPLRQLPPERLADRGDADRRFLAAALEEAGQPVSAGGPLEEAGQPVSAGGPPLWTLPSPVAIGPAPVSQRSGETGGAGELAPVAPRQDEIYEKWRRFYSSALRAADDRIRGDGSPGDQATGLGHDEAEDTRKVLRVTAVIIEYSGWSTFSAACAALGWGLAVFVAAMAPLIAAPPVALALMIAVGTSGTAVIYLSWKHRDILRMAKAIGADFRPKFRSIRKEFGRSPEGMRALDSLYNQCVDRIVENISREAA